MRHAMTFLYLAALANVASGADAPHRTESQLLKSYAVSQCIARAYPESPVSADAKAAAAGFLEYGSVGPEAYSEIVALADEALGKQYLGKGGEPLHVMKCIDLLFDKRLADVVEKYAGRGPTDGK